MPVSETSKLHQKVKIILSKTISDAYIYSRNEDDIGLLQSIISNNVNNHNSATSLIQYKPTPEKLLLDRILNKEYSLSKLTNSLATSFNNTLLPNNTNYKYEINSLKQSDQALFTALKALNKPADKRAPTLFSSTAWQRKQLNCTLGAWAEYRHAIGTTQTSNRLMICATREPAGFIEPVPEFFQALGIASEKLASRSKKFQNAKPKYSLFLFALFLEDALSEFKNCHWPFFSHQHAFLLNSIETEEPLDMRDSKSRKLFIDKLVHIIQEYWLGKTKAISQLYKDSHQQLEQDTITPRLKKLAILCYRLEAMSRKQLAKKPWTKLEEQFIKGYGKKLANMMHYFGNSYLAPRDDAPSITQIAHLAVAFSEEILHCGNARPRKIIINYPDHKGRIVTCYGSVYNYREIISESPITDKTWRKTCQKTTSPAWLSPVLEQ